MKNDFFTMLDEIYGDTVDDAAVAEAELAIDIATQFAALRNRRELTQRDLADIVGKTQQAISKIENPAHGGHNLALLKRVIAQMDAVLDVTIVSLEDLDVYQSLRPPKPVLEDFRQRRFPALPQPAVNVPTWPPSWAVTGDSDSISISGQSQADAANIAESRPRGQITNFADFSQRKAMASHG